MLGSSNTLFHFAPAEGFTNALYNRNSGTIDLGGIAGGPGRISQQTVAGGADVVTYSIGALNLDTTFTGYILDAERTTAFTKVGTGRLTLNDVALEHKGTLAISNGVLAFAGATVNSSSNATTIVASPGILSLGGAADPTLRLGTGTAVQTLRGNGTIRGSLVLGANGRLEPGFSLGVLTVTNTAQLGGVTTMQIDGGQSPNSDRLVAQYITFGGALVVTNIGGALTPGTFQLFSGTVSGSFSSVTLPDLNCGTLAWNTNNLSVNGSIAITGTPCAATYPTNITVVSVVGNQLNLEWPETHFGWTLQTNAVGVAASGSWFPYPGSHLTTQVSATINPAQSNVFFRLVLP